MHDEHYPFERIAVSAPLGLCPRCDGTTMVRSDTGLCERCSAKRPEAIAAWQATRARLGRPKPREVVPHCWVCGTVLPPGVSEWRHKLTCPSRPLGCGHCTRRFDTERDRQLHEDKWHPAA